jgi:hypothetical protein
MNGKRVAAGKIANLKVNIAFLQGEDEVKVTTQPVELTYQETPADKGGMPHSLRKFGALRALAAFDLSILLYDLPT